MIWLTWRQHRKQALFAVVGLAVLVAVMLPTGLEMHHAFVNTGLAKCLSKLGDAQLVPNAAADTCQGLSQRFQSRFNAMAPIAILLLVLPLLVGLFFGAPLVARELEFGTHRFVWTQEVSRLRWALVKFGLVGGFVLLIATVYAFGAGWWVGPLSEVGDGRLGDLVFDMQGIVPIGYTVFAVALGILAGTLWRRVLPAMAVTLAGFFGVRVLIEMLARPHYLAPKELTYALASPLAPNPATGDWVYTNGVRDAAGRMVAPNAQIQCPDAGAGPAGGGLNPGPVAAGGGGGGGGGLGNGSVHAAAGQPIECTAQGGLGPGAYNWEQYQPGSRFWAFQGIETGIFLALAVVLVYVAIRRLKRTA